MSMNVELLYLLIYDRPTDEFFLLVFLRLLFRMIYLLSLRIGSPPLLFIPLETSNVFASIHSDCVIDLSKEACEPKRKGPTLLRIIHDAEEAVKIFFWR